MGLGCMGMAEFYGTFNEEITTIPGTRKVHRLQENLGAFEVELTEADLVVMEKHMPKTTVGNRY